MCRLLFVTASGRSKRRPGMKLRGRGRRTERVAVAISRMVHLLEDRPASRCSSAPRTGSPPPRLDAPIRPASRRCSTRSQASPRRSPRRPARADDRGGTDVRHAMADPAACGLPAPGAGHRGALRRRGRGGCVRRGLDLRHHARQRRLAGLVSERVVRRRSPAGVCAAARRPPQAARRSQRSQFAGALRMPPRNGRCGRAAGVPRLAAKGPEFEAPRTGLAGSGRRRRRRHGHRPLHRRRHPRRPARSPPSRSPCPRARSGHPRP